MPRASPGQKHLNAVLTTPRDAGSRRRRPLEDADFDGSGGHVDADVDTEPVTSKRPRLGPQQTDKSPGTVAGARLALISPKANDAVVQRLAKKNDKRFVDRKRCPNDASCHG